MSPSQKSQHWPQGQNALRCYLSPADSFSSTRGSCHIQASIPTSSAESSPDFSCSFGHTQALSSDASSGDGYPSSKFTLSVEGRDYEVFYKDPPPTRLRSTAVKAYCERVARFLPFRNPQPDPDVIQKICAPWQLVSLRQPSTKGRELPLQPWQLLEIFRHPRVQRRCLLAIFQLVDGFWEILVHRDDFLSFEKAAKAADFQIDANHRPGDPLASFLDSTPEDQRGREELAGRAALAWLVSTEVDDPEASVASIYCRLVDLYRCRGLFVKKVQAFLEYKPDHGLSHRVFVTGYHHYMILETDNKKERVLKCKMVRLLNKQL